MESFREIIEAWPTRREMAADLGAISVQRVHKWHQRNHIPGDVDVLLIPALQRRGVSLSYEDLARLRAQPSASEGEAA